MPHLRPNSLLDLPSSDSIAQHGTVGTSLGDSLRPAGSSITLAPHARPQSEHGTNSPLSRLSHEVHPDDISERSTDNGAHSAPSKRFSLMRFRNYSESHLSARAKMDGRKSRDGPASAVPRVPAVNRDSVLPKIHATGPTGGSSPSTQSPSEEKDRNKAHAMLPRGASRSRKSPNKDERDSVDDRRTEGKSTSFRWLRGKNGGLEDLHRLSSMNMGSHSAAAPSAPPSYGDETTSALAVPVAQLADPRFSESSLSDRSNGSSGDGQIYASTTTTTTHTVSTHTTFFRLQRRNQNRNSLFPLPVKISPPPPLSVDEAQQYDQQGLTTPRASEHPTDPDVLSTPTPDKPPRTQLRRRHTATSPVKQRPHSQSLSSAYAALTRDSRSSVDPGSNLFRRGSQLSHASGASSPLQPPMHLASRDRSSTTSSLGQSSQDPGTPPPPSLSGRNSTSTTGRSSFGALLNLSRFRQGSEPHSPRHGSPGTNSKSNSFALSREALVVPEREEGDTPGKYLERLESAVSRSLIAGILSKSSDPFASAVLRSYNRRFPFFGEPVDMSLRKFLLEAELPKETQQVDRVIQAFADRYHECNPGIFPASDQAYVIAFSIMMLHTDAFNKNNKRKMTKADYIKNTSGQGLDQDILACFYDNICYTPFVHYDEDVDINGEKVLPFKAKRSGGKLKSAIPGSDVVKKSTGPVDPYNLLVDQKLDTLRPPIKDTIAFDDTYDYRGSQGELDPQYLQRAFTHTGVLQIISARSRPAAYESQVINGQPNPTEDQQGIVDLKITKVGTLWRKSAKKKKTRSPWQEWGAVLTGSQLYMFKNSHWAKGLMHQFMQHQKPGHPRVPVVFKPPLLDFKPDALIKTDNAVALVDHSYQRHKNAFTFVRPGGQEETLLADNESELNEWLGLINYAAAFRAAGVRIRGMLGGPEDDSRNRDARRSDLVTTARSVQTTTAEATAQNRGLSFQLHRQVMAARRQLMTQKIGELEKDIADANKQLEIMLRNARHLLVLAPIAPKTRDDVIHSAARADATIKWARRDIWRLKCHRDILAMDVRLDGLSATELDRMVQDTVQPQEQESSKKEKPKMPPRLSSTRTATARSPPRSPTAPQSAEDLPSTAESPDAFAPDEVFRTPPESASSQREEAWRLPPLSPENTPDQQHRPSVTSTLLSVSSSVNHRVSGSPSSPSSSILQAQRSLSAGPADGTPTPGLDEKECEMLARSDMAPAPKESLGPAGDVTHPTAPDNKQKIVRKSLQKTLRDAHYHHHHPSTHKHRRNKESESTVRSITVDDRRDDESAPGLHRDKPRFILHGKQASVVQFGGDWERMKMRREQYEHQHHPASSPTRASRSATRDDYERRRIEQNERLRAGMTSPAVHDLRDRRSSSDDEDEDGPDGAEGSILSMPSFREDAEAAAAYSATDGTNRWAAAPTSSSLLDRDGPTPFSSDHHDLVDLSSFWDTDAGIRTLNRQTVIGPSRPVQPQQQQQQQRSHSQPADEDHSSPRRNRSSNRLTVLGPLPWMTTTTASSPATDQDNRSVELISDEELRRVTTHSNAHAS